MGHAYPLALGITLLTEGACMALAAKLLNTFPGCITKSVESVRKHKLAHWYLNSESNREWLGLNMMTEANAGFRAFNEGSKQCREADFLLLRRRLAEGAVWGDELVEDLLVQLLRDAPAGLGLQALTDPGTQLEQGLPLLQLGGEGVVHLGQHPAIGSFCDLNLLLTQATDGQPHDLFGLQIPKERLPLRYRRSRPINHSQDHDLDAISYAG